MLKKLRIKFILFTMALVCVMLCVVFATMYGYTAQNLERQSIETMYTLTSPLNLPNDMRPKVQGSYLVLTQTVNGAWLVQSSNAFEYGEDSFLRTLMEEVAATGSREGILEEHSLRFLYMDKPFPQYVFLDISTEQNVLKLLVRTFCLIGAGSLALFFGISLLLANIALKPVEKAWAEQKQFVADASHELKTPLAVITTNAELLEDDSYSPQEHQQFESNIRTMAQQMRNLVEGLLELTRLDNVTPDMEVLDISALAENVTLPFEPVFFEAGMELNTRITPSLWVKGSRLHLQQVMEIFLDNALKYGTGGEVTLSLQQAGNNVLLVAENEGIPLSQEDAKKIFLRFYRTDPARKRDGSYGLGLSIAQKIVQQHGGKIWAEGTASGNRFSVLIPLDHKENLPQLHK